jgi:hypothetical protein
MVSKRQLGIIVIVAASVMVAGLFAADLIGAGRWGGFGPLQRIGVGAALVAVVGGVLLLRLGHRPA